MELMILAGLVYLFPAILAYNNKKANAGAIALLTLLLGWTLVGWVAALVWAACKDKQSDAEKLAELLAKVEARK